MLPFLVGRRRASSSPRSVATLQKDLAGGFPAPVRPPGGHWENWVTLPCGAGPAPCLLVFRAGHPFLALELKPQYSRVFGRPRFLQQFMHVYSIIHQILKACNVLSPGDTLRPRPRKPSPHGAYTREYTEIQRP